MTFKKFRESNPKFGYYVVTSLPNERSNKPEANALMWEPSNSKWYRPEALEGRRECGYCDRIYLQHFEEEHSIVDVRSMTAGSPGIE